MKKTYLFLLATLLLFVFGNSVHAQHGFIKGKIKESMKEKYAEPQKEKGREAIKDNTYENDSRYPVPENPVKATLALEINTYKKNGKLKETSTSKMIFGNTGECMVVNEGKKEESRMIFDYEGAATYIVNTEEKSAIKMPMINFQKMVEKMAERHADLDDDNGEWTRTDEYQKINSYNCRKYVYTNAKEKTKMDVWVTQDISIDLSGNHLLGGEIRDFSKEPITSKPANGAENLPKGVMIRNVQYEKDSDTPSSQMDLVLFEKKSDPKYFDLSDYEINDVLDGL